MLQPRPTLLVLLLSLANLTPIFAAEPQWIWSHKDAATKAEAGEVGFRTAFNLDGTVESASITATGDNTFDLFLNGRHVGSGDNWMQRTKFDVKPLLVPGRNIVAIRCTNGGEDPAGLAAKVEIKVAGKDAITVSTDDKWKFSKKLLGNWARVEFDDSKWENAVALGEYGKIGPWGAAGAIVAGQTSTTPAQKAKNQDRGLFHFKDNDRLVLLGSAFIERMQSNGYFELELISAHPDKNITVRNLGWSGDNVWGDARAVFGGRADGFKRLLSDVNLCSPSVILVCYGENEAYAGEAGLEEFRGGFSTLLDALEKTGARLVIATPRKHENVGKPFPDQTKYNADLRKYCDVMKEVAKERELAFVDWLDVADGSGLTENGIHLTNRGYDLCSADLISTLGGKRDEISIDIDLSNRVMEIQGAIVEGLETNEKSLVISLRDLRLPQVITVDRGNKEQQIISEDFDFRVRGLAKGRYELYVDGEQRGERRPSYLPSESDLAQGNVIMFGTNTKLSDTCEKLLAAINEKNFLFFNRYRPQNETYLFLFRKHEQGNNAVEIPQFDPLIAEQEKIIAELKKPPKQKFELKRVSE